MNLCVNAIDALPEIGLLLLRTRNVGAWVELEIEDNGAGMPQEVLEKAFEPFLTTKSEGHGKGLGLAMEYRTVTAHRGTIALQSTVGEGTCVLLRFPAHPKSAEVPEPGEPLHGNQSSSLQFLLVDDDELVQDAVGMVLETLGHRPVLASSGEIGLELVGAGLYPNMPGLGGAGTLPRLRAALPEVPILLPRAG